MAIARVPLSCNPVTLTDKRGGIFTYLPDDPVVEWNLLFTRAGEARGFHFHREFDEYILITDGNGVYLERREDGGEVLFPVVAGDCLHFPAGTAHTLRAITDMRMVALLTKRWDDCDEPLTRLEDA